MLAATHIQKKGPKKVQKCNENIEPTEFKEEYKILIKSHPMSSAAYREMTKIFEIYSGPNLIHKGLRGYIIDTDKIVYGPYI